ncbi:hypothetical protein JFT85_00620 [Pseudomonas sp. TH04]|uniref:hypothetical protein n=1 Tax=Pseudomonas sp. TH04 TaxID=2796370 RepID=UPI001913AF31|nr:hypothetical protein [Pseudomonas sp. TH04]MBK5543268.1 hypothetical protein [Pseudomonas sp. TH04]
MNDKVSRETRKFKDYEILVVVHFPSEKTAEKFTVQYQVSKDGLPETELLASHEPQATLDEAFEHGYSMGRSYIETLNA